MSPEKQAHSEPSLKEAEAILELLARSFMAAAESPETNGVLPSAPLPPKKNLEPFPWTESALRSLLKAIPDAMVLINREGVIVHINEQAERLFGYQSGEVLGETIELLIPEQFRIKHVKDRDGYFAKPHSRPMGIGKKLYGRHKDGNEIPVDISLSPLETEHGLFAIAMIRDITQRKKEEAKFQTLVENIPAVTFYAPLDETSMELYVSPQIEEMLGFSKEEWLADPVLWFRQLHPEDQERWNAQFAPTCADGTTFQEDYRFIAKDGRVVWVHGSAKMVWPEGSQTPFLQGVAFDITKQKQHAEELRRLNAELEQRVAERTLALEQSLHALEEKTKELEKFAYVTSHDFQSPLRSLINYPQKLVKEYGAQLDERANDWLQRTINGAERMRRFIHDLLQYSRVVSRERVFEPVDCNEVFQIVCSNLQADIEQAEAKVTSASLPTVKGYQTHLIVLFQNLISNAIKFRDHERLPCVEVEAVRQGKSWLFQVRDNGIGIEEKYLERIFDLGERLHSESKYPGNGFGLTICKKIVNSHGGTIEVRSEFGQGSCFYFTLPDSTA